MHDMLPKTAEPAMMQGYAWARTPSGELFIVLIVDGKGHVPGVENAADLSQIDILEPVNWPAAITRPSSGGNVIKFKGPTCNRGAGNV
jgi:hypothetical protein